VTDRRGFRVKSSLDAYWPRHDAGLPGRGERFRPEADRAYPAGQAERLGVKSLVGQTPLVLNDTEGESWEDWGQRALAPM